MSKTAAERDALRAELVERQRELDVYVKRDREARAEVDELKAILADTEAEENRLEAEVARIRAATCGKRCGDGESDGACVECDVHGFCHLCEVEDYQRQVADLKAEVERLRKTPPPKPCGECNESLGARFYSDVPTSRGRMNLCLDCWSRATSSPSLR